MGLLHLLTKRLNICDTKESRTRTLVYQICRTRAKRCVPRHITPCLYVDHYVLQLHPAFAPSLGNMPQA